jgi:hypothetical protein
MESKQIVSRVELKVPVNVCGQGDTIRLEARQGWVLELPQGVGGPIRARRGGRIHTVAADLVLGVERVYA